MYKFELVNNTSELAEFNQYIKKSLKCNFRQTSYWGEIKAFSGWEPMNFVLKEKGEVKGTVLIQKRKIPFSPFSLMYCSRGPIVDWSDSESCKALFSGLADVVKTNFCICLRFDPEPGDDIICLEKQFKSNNLFKINDRVSSWNRNLYSTRIILGEDDDILFSKMRRTHRQNIKTSIKKGVYINSEPLPNDKDNFFDLMKGLEYRRNSLIHPKKYYDNIYDLVITNNIGVFMKAMFEGKIISGLIVVVIGNKAWALFMANDYEYRKLMPNKLLLWGAIKYSNNQGCRYLDLGSTQGTETFDPENDSLDFLKKAYNPEIKYYPGYFDMKGIMYSGFRIMERFFIPIFFKYYYKINRMLKMK